MKIGLLGGSFDPIHNAHVQMAKQARKQLGLQEVWFVVANDTPLKERRLSAFTDRCAMVEIAISAYHYFRICTMEKERQGKNYTIDTIASLKKIYPENEFYFIIGQDQVAQLHKWRDIEKLQTMVQLCAFARNGNAIITPYRIKALSMPNYAISSTDVRAGNYSNVHPGVTYYALSHMLYMDFVKEAMSEYRYQHSIHVAKLCAYLAKHHHLDVNKAYLCGLLHDINKEFIVIDQIAGEKIINTMRPALLNYRKSIWHGYLGSFICAHKLKIRDSDILIAIENHVLGECRNKYAMLLFVADKLEPTRNYDTTALISLCRKDLVLGYQEVRRQQTLYYGEENASGK